MSRPRSPNVSEQPQIGRTIGESVQAWPARRGAPDGAPNIVVIVLDDVGFAHYGCFGSAIATPNIDRLANDGLRYTNFHTAALCSPTRAALLTGRHPHSVGFGHITERAAGFPGYSMRLPDSAATVAEILRRSGYSTRAIGKWHLAPNTEVGPQGPFERWPLGQGFERYYGFLGGATDQYRPDLARDNTHVSAPASPLADYHLSEDLVDEAITQVRDLRGLAPAKPFLLYLAFGAGHAPHQAPAAWIDRYAGAFDHGWDVERERILARQIELGIFPPATQLGQSNPGVEAWEALTADQRHVFARMMEVYAGFISHTDAQIGRLLDLLDHVGVADDTAVLLLSDNGASAEGGPEGSLDSHVDQDATEMSPHLDALGGPTFYNHYPWGWAQAGNTPFRWYKQFTHAGGITNGLVIRWPREIPAGGIRRQYHHVIDITPTVLDIAGVSPPATVAGVTQLPLHGASMRGSFQDEDAHHPRHVQHYEMWGNRGIWQDGWMAVCRLHSDSAGVLPPRPMSFDELPWELYDHRSDPTENVDLAASESDRLQAMVQQWWALAGRYDVLPVDDRRRGDRWPVDPPSPEGAEPGQTTFFGRGGPYEPSIGPRLAGRPFVIEAEIECVDDRPSGVLYAFGGRHGGYCWYLDEGHVHLEAAPSSIVSETASAPLRLTSGRHTLAVALEKARGHVRFLLDGSVIGEEEIRGLGPQPQAGSRRTYIGHAPSGTPSGSFTPPYPFDGTIHRLTVVPGIASAPSTVREQLAAELREQ